MLNFSFTFFQSTNTYYKRYTQNAELESEDLQMKMINSVVARYLKRNYVSKC